MAEPVTVARPYAEAVFKLAREQNALAKWSDALANLDAVVGDAQMQVCVSDPNVSAQQLEALVLGVIGDKLDAQVAGAARNFVQVLVQNGRLELTQVKQLVSALEAKYQRKVTAKVETDASLIGGVKIVVGDKVIDATVRGKLDAMAAALTH